MRKEIFFANAFLFSAFLIQDAFAPQWIFAQAPKSKKNSQLDLADDSYRLVLNFNDPRRYATRFLKETRTLQIRIVPATAQEMKNTAFYDPRYIQRVVVQEKDSEVILNLQLKNFPMSWMVATQDKPWRLIVDFWKTQQDKPSLNQAWNWQPDILSESVGEPNENGLPAAGEKISQAFSKDNVAGINQIKEKLIEKTIKEDHPNKETSKSGGESKLTQQPTHPYDLPDIYSRLELITPFSDVSKAELNKQLGSTFGGPNEFQVAKKLANDLYQGGYEKNALTIYRKLAALNEQEFVQDDKVLWQAGESAYLSHEFEMANDYFRRLMIQHPGSSFLDYAKLRITDIDELTNSQNKGRGKVGVRNAQTYSSLALNEKSPFILRVASTLRVLDGVVESDPEAVKNYQQNLDTCITSRRVPFDLLKNCAYYLDRYLADKDTITKADIAVQQFKKLSPGDPRAAALEGIVQERVKALLAEIAKSKDWNAWVEFEKKARPALLSFTFQDADALFTRASAFQAVGEDKKAVQLYESYLKSGSDNKKRNEAACLSSLLLYRLNDSKKANDFLKRLEQNDARKSEGLTDKSLVALKELSVAPYHNKIALNVLMDEIKLGRYEERSLSTLFEWSKELRGKPQGELVYEKILAYPAKSAEEIQIVESSIMQYANDLRDSERFSKAGDMFLAVANLSQGTRRSEAAYKAGVVYARAGLFDKAKAAWLLAANDTSDKRYSSLASERLDRINK